MQCYLIDLFSNNYAQDLLKNHLEYLRILGVQREQVNQDIPTYYSYRVFMLISTTFLCFFYSMWEKN